MGAKMINFSAASVLVRLAQGMSKAKAYCNAYSTVVHQSDKVWAGEGSEACNRLRSARSSYRCLEILGSPPLPELQLIVGFRPVGPRRVVDLIIVPR